MKKIPVGATIAHAYGFAFGKFPAVLRVTAPALVLQLALSLFMIGRMIPALEAIEAKDPSAFSLLGPVLLLYPLAFILFFVQFTSVTELALGQVMDASWFHFPLGKKMWRLLGGFIMAVLAIAGLLLAAGLVAWLMAVLVSSALSAASPVAAKAIAGLLALLAILACYCGLIFVVVRFFFLLAPVNVAEARLGVGRAWLLSRGNFWRAFLVTLAIVLPITILEYVFIFAAVGFPPMPQGGGAQAYETARLAWQTSILSTIWRHWYISLPVFAVIMVLYLGAGCAAQVFAYRKLTEDEALAPVAAD